MTLSAELQARPADLIQAIKPRLTWPLFESGALGVAFATFALIVVPGAGGRDENTLIAGLATMTVAFVVLRSWRVVPRMVLGSLVTIAAGVALVCVAAPTGGAGLRDAAAYVYALVTFATVMAFCRSEGRRQVVVIATCLVALDQFSRGFLPWWGGESASKQMIGTFYAHNQFAAFVLAGGLVAGLSAVFGTGLQRRVGFLTTPLCATGVMVSASRGSMLLMFAGWLTVGLVTLLQKDRRRAAFIRWVVVAVSAAACVALMTSGLVFRNGGAASGVAAVQQRESQQTASHNVTFRIHHAEAALAIAKENPLVGAGFGSFIAASAPHIPLGSTRTTYAHNGFLQAVSDGGAVLGIPFLLAMLAGLFRVLRLLLGSVRKVSRAGSRVICGAAALVLMAHSFIDVDWAYPALFAFGSALLAVALSRDETVSRAGTPNDPTRGAVVARALSLVLVVIAIGALAGLERWEQVDSALTASGGQVESLAGLRSPVASDARIEAVIVDASVPGRFDGRLRLPIATAKDALRRSARPARIDGHLQMQRAQVTAATGQPALGIAMGMEVVRRYGVARPYLIAEQAELLNAFGQKEQARALLDGAISDRARPDFPSREALVTLTMTLQRLFPEDEHMRCTVLAVQRAVAGDIKWDGKVSAAAPTAPCG
jgi:hypothetical protein